MTPNLGALSNMVYFDDYEVYLKNICNKFMVYIPDKKVVYEICVNVVAYVAIATGCPRMIYTRQQDFFYHLL